MRFLRVLWLGTGVLAAALALAHGTLLAQGESAPRVLAVEFSNDINPVTEDFLTGEIERADREGFAAVVLLLDTPGGLGSSMREIIKAELRATIPVVVYVSPQGARADSAGAFLAMAADVAAMAPQTNIGSSTPVNVGGTDIQSDLRRKIVNDAAAYIRELAEEHGRNGDLAEDFVRDGANIGARRALEDNVVDALADDLPTLLEEIDGMRTEPKGLTLETAGARIETVEMSFWKRVLDTLVDPNLIVILMSLGILGITVEILSPGLIFPGTIGGVSLILGLLGLQVLPISWAGLLLIGLGLTFFVAEGFIVSHGALTLAGAASFVVGALILFDPAGELYDVSVWVAVAIAATLALLIGVALAKAIVLRRSKPQTGQDELIGDVAIVRRALDPEGLVFVHGELWSACAQDGPVAVGEAVRVEAVGEDLVLEVSAVSEREPATA
ncbi:MAG: nodulation protein NfeD [Actinobacteria bacterium]|nr:nodulation protein NfeD [Actinomycetota bacterium]